MIPTSAVLDTFDKMLTVAGFDCDHPDPLLAWRVFKEFAAIAVECADDALLFQVGTFTFSGEQRFHFDFTRQFTHEEDGEYVGMEQLHCTVYYDPSAELLPLEASVWSFDSASPSEFFAHVEAMPEFQTPIRIATPLQAQVAMEEV